MYKMEDQSIFIVTDYRENASGIPQRLIDNGVVVNMKVLKSGDYLINDQVLVERKTKDDFSLSLIQNRLFAQCAQMRKTSYHPLFLIEGNPYKTIHKMDRQAIKGALLSVSVAWHIPIIYSSGPDESAQMLIMVARQNLKENVLLPIKRYKPKVLKKQNLYFLQGLPTVGPQMAQNLLRYFGTVDCVLSASNDELQKVSGIGKDRAVRIKMFLSNSQNE